MSAMDMVCFEGEHKFFSVPLREQHLHCPMCDSILLPVPEDEARFGDVFVGAFPGEEIEAGFLCPLGDEIIRASVLEGSL